MAAYATWFIVDMTKKSLLVFNLILILPVKSSKIDNASFLFTENQNWEELVEIAAAESVDLQAELVSLLCQYGDTPAAVKWAARFSIPEDILPFHLVPLVKEAAMCCK